MEQVSLDEISIDLFTSTETTPEEELISQEGIHRLNLAIDSLPAKCKMAFKLVREDKLKYKEVAAILDISVKTLEAHLTNAVRKLRELLEKVVSEGSGKNAYLEGYSIGGKTATSQTLPRSAGKYISSFIGFAPADDPQILGMVIIHDPQGIYYGGTIAAPVAKEIFENILPYLDK